MKLLLALLVFAAPFANAGGRLSAQLNDFQGHDKVYPILGLSVDQQMFEKLFVTGWTGYGTRPVQDDGTKHWAAAKAGLEYRMSAVNVGAGVFSATGGSGFGDVVLGEDAGSHWESGSYVKASLKIW